MTSNSSPNLSGEPINKDASNESESTLLEKPIFGNWANAYGLPTAIPLSGFKTPYLPSSRWVDMKKINTEYDHEVFGKRAPGEKLAEASIYEIAHGNENSYPSWGPPEKVPISKEEMEAIFLQLTEIFGFQYDNTRNMYDHFLRLLDSRSSRVGPSLALRSLHADYIGGINSNFKKWYFAAELDLDDFSELENSHGEKKGKRQKSDDLYFSLEQAEVRWSCNMNTLSPADYVIQISLYLLCWGEANNIRFMPECLCFIFKCCNDYYYSLDINTPIKNATPSFLDHAITPLYNFIRDQSYQLENGKYIRSDKDHKNIIGYDDINQLFWYAKSLRKIVLKDKKTKLMNLSPAERYLRLNEVNWKKAFSKTFKETRTWTHVLVNFSRIWIIHISAFWLYTLYNSPTLYTKDYKQDLDNQPTVQMKLTLMALVGGIATLICLLCTIFEMSFVPRDWPGAQPVLKRLFFLSLMFSICVAPTIYLLISYNIDEQSTWGVVLASFQLAASIISVVYLSITPSAQLFAKRVNKDDRRYLSNREFCSSFYCLNGTDKVASHGIWIVIFFSKFVESYFFLTLSLRDPVRELNNMKLTRCVGDVWLGSWLCSRQTTIVLILIYFTDLVLFFLDTYLWYIVWNTVFSVCRSFYIGVSIWTPWKNIYSRLPKRIHSKIISNRGNKNVNMKFLVSEVWNSIIISMYREHLLSIEHIHKLIYQQIPTANSESGYILKEPIFFVSQEDQSLKSSLFLNQSEAQRRITFFAQSLSTPMPEVGSTNSMPSFTVLVPHYGEKITLTLKEIIKEEDQYSYITMLEYLKQLHPIEWDCFVKDTKMLAEEFESENTSIDLFDTKKLEDLSYYSVGFKVATPEYILRTRIWASLRSQTLYRTISGFMNYSRAIKLLYDVENSTSQTYEDEYIKLEEAAIISLRKFRIIASMQRLKHFNEEEKESTEFLLRAYPELQIAYLDEELDPETGDIIYYSSLIDGSSAILENGDRKPKYRIRLSGNPILGDGKSDNQNHALIFCRGEYIQLVDANQDNYLEECLKIRSVLAEFEETTIPSDPYSIELRNTLHENPVAIIGTREYIFSENIGILGDVAAGKEQTFGTLFARTLAHIGGKLHYGHPDFLNSVFMATRGGVSKAQKGLHLNEDIYAGMNAIMRGGRIKHCEYMQCGKGRDLGFGSILNFTTKIGAGMGEQMLSREYFYLGTQLPLDRFLSFYYAHPGFHLNNVFIILSIKLFLFVCVNLAALTNESTICEYDRHRPITDPRKPLGCYNLMPVVEWMKRCIYSIFIVFAISFVPLCVQELTERGFYKALTRLGKHFASFSPLFEVFVCRIYAQSLSSDINIGGARYIGTGRGFATVRMPFSTLYSRFASESLYFGAFSCLLVLYASITMWVPVLLYFWVTIIGLLICPCLYNPNQFSWCDFFLDYTEYIQWLYRGNTKTRKTSWIGYTRISRSKLIGVKNQKSRGKEEVRIINDVKPSKTSLIFNQMTFELFGVATVGCAYMFANSQNDSRATYPGFALLRILIISVCPIVINMVVLLVFFLISCILGPLGSLISSKFPSVLAAIVHLISVLNYVFFFEVLWYFQNWDFSRTIIGVALVIAIQSWIIKLLTIVFVTREFGHDRSNRAWWSGKWITSGLGWYVLTQPLREYFCKISELSYYVGDVLLGHLILFSQIPIIVVPYIDTWHSLMLFWLKPVHQIRPRVFSKSQRRKLNTKVTFSVILFILSLCIFLSIFLIPTIAIKNFDFDVDEFVPELIQELIQPFTIVSSRKGLQGSSKAPH
ncbi:1,3-beta-glucan synthase component Gsc2p [[Candida] anglica]